MHASVASKLAAKRTATNGTIDLLVIVILSGKQSRHVCARLRKIRRDRVKLRVFREPGGDEEVV